VADFLMPSLGADMEWGTLACWHKRPGEPLAHGEVIAEVMTDKGVIEVEWFQGGGVVEEILVEEGAYVPVGTVLARVRETAGGAAPAPGSEPEPKPEAAPQSAPEPAPIPEPATVAAVAAREPAPAASLRDSVRSRSPHRLRVSPFARRLAGELGLGLGSVTGSGPGGAVLATDVRRAAAGHGEWRASPTARRLAHEQGIDLSTVSGSGPHGAIGYQDVAGVLATPAPPAPAAPTAEERKQSMRRAIAKALSRSKREIPHYYLSHSIDLTEALNWLENENRERSVSERVLSGALLLKAIARALRKFPELNARWENDRMIPHEGIHLGVAISLRSGGLVAPAILGADQLALPDLMIALKDLALRARDGKLRGSEISAATVTVSSLGDRGVDTLFGVIYPGQTALIGVGTPALRPWVVGGGLSARTIVTITLSADHRASDGHRGARFLRALDKLLQEPSKL
jgi:pyruvate dehydrogenase E2 component (dihydrolipoamide acetyltransferase)